jgi:hypothetical protein
MTEIQKLKRLEFDSLGFEFCDLGFKKFNSGKGRPIKSIWVL